MSNFENGDEKFPIQLDHFIVNEYIIQLDNVDFRYFPSGVSLSPDEIDRLNQELPQVIAMGGINHAARYLVAMQRRVASRTTAVGHHAMVVSIPVMRTVPGMHLFLTSLDSDDVADDNPHFSYVRPHSFSPNRFAPLVSSGDGFVSELTHLVDGEVKTTTLHYLSGPPWDGNN
ncbi:hypothetical protein A5635_03850 [Mycobacterium asiaticum]|uniref:Uncharacterized protein n=1 Tax=Mycobacterium asiaticum TaxID=1790 RepID=A0A1A3NBK3_MYCAS|nr:hypothetical protein A5635_03850 [Mycobacterium asiaticum]